MRDGITIEKLDPKDIEVLAPLWKALLDHIAVLPDAIVPIRPFEQSWPLERAAMLEALDGDAFVEIEGPDPVWYTGDRHAVLAALSVADGERGAGVGTALFDAVDAELAGRGVEDVEIGVDTANVDAMRFYEERGYRHDFHIFYGTPGRKPWACLRRDAEDKEAGRGRYAPPGPDGSPSAPHSEA